MSPTLVDSLTGRRRSPIVAMPSIADGPQQRAGHTRRGVGRRGRPGIRPIARRGRRRSPKKQVGESRSRPAPPAARPRPPVRGDLDRVRSASRRSRRRRRRRIRAGSRRGEEERDQRLRRALLASVAGDPSVFALEFLWSFAVGGSEGPEAPSGGLVSPGCPAVLSSLTPGLPPEFSGKGRTYTRTFLCQERNRVLRELCIKRQGTSAALIPRSLRPDRAARRTPRRGPTCAG